MPTFRRNRMKVYKTNLYFTNVGFVSADYSTDAQQVFMYIRMEKTIKKLLQIYPFQYI